MDADPDSPSHSLSTPAIAAIVVVAVVVAGVIALMFRPPPEPDPCETWNWEVRGRAQGYLGGREFLSGLPRTTVALRAHVQEIRLELRDLADDRPDDCEIEEETQDLLQKSESQ